MRIAPCRFRLRSSGAPHFCGRRFQTPSSSAMAKPYSSLERILEKTIFASRWLQAPLYVGLIVAQGIYVYQFFVELWHLLHIAISGTPAGGPDASTMTMLMVLGLID